MANGERKEAMQGKPAVGSDGLDSDEQRVYVIDKNFYGGADMRANRIRVISNKHQPITIMDEFYISDGKGTD